MLLQEGRVNQDLMVFLDFLVAKDSVEIQVRPDTRDPMGFLGKKVCATNETGLKPNEACI